MFCVLVFLGILCCVRVSCRCVFFADCPASDQHAVVHPGKDRPDVDPCHPDVAFEREALRRPPGRLVVPFLYTFFVDERTEQHAP